MRSSLMIKSLQNSSKAGYFAIREIATTSSLPFVITRTEAHARFASHWQFLSASNSTQEKSNQLQLSEKDPITEGFIPFHSADVPNVSCTFSGRFGIDRVQTNVMIIAIDSHGNTTTQISTQVITDWTNCQGHLSNTNYPFGTPYTQIYAGFDYPEKLVEAALQTNDVKRSVPITADMLNFGGTKKAVFPHDMNMAYAMEKLYSKVYDLELERARQFIMRKYNADHAEITSLDVHLDNNKLRLYSYHMPAYIYKTTVSNLISCKIMNANDGTIKGNNVLSIEQSSMLGAGIGAVLSLVLGMVGRPYLLPVQILFRVIVGSSMGAVASAGMAKWFNAYNNFQFVEGAKQSAAKNAQYFESDEDKVRKQFAANHKQSPRFIFDESPNAYLPVDKCRLLGIDVNKKITPAELKKARDAKLLKWHPDFFNNKNEQSKLQANAMSSQINVAYSEISNILKHK
jgi:hypothetical protein